MSAVVSANALEAWRPHDLPPGWVLMEVRFDLQQWLPYHVLWCRFMRIYIGEPNTVAMTVAAEFYSPDEATTFIAEVLPWLSTHPAARVPPYSVDVGRR